MLEYVEKFNSSYILFFLLDSFHILKLPFIPPVECWKENCKHSLCVQVAKWFGAAVNNKFGWQPNMKNYDIEVVIAVFETRVVVGLALTNEALHRRNISVFGHTTLNSTIAYGLS